MRYDWRNDPNAPKARKIINTDTGETMRYIAMADDETGEYEQYLLRKKPELDPSTWSMTPPVFEIDPITQRAKTVKGVAPLVILF